MRTLLVWLFLAVTVVGQAAQPAQFNYQALLRDDDGVLLQGAHTLHIGLWEGGSSGTPNANILLYGETANVTITDGVVNHVIGTGTPTGGPLDAASLDTDAAVFVQVAVDAPGNVVLPRTRLQPVPYAVEAETAESALNGIPPGTIILRGSPVTPPGYTALGTRLSASWEARRPMPTARLGCAAAVAQGRLYVVGGELNDLNVTGISQAYDPATNTWSTTAPLTTPRTLHTLTEVGGLLYAVGGATGPSTLGNTNRYDPSTGVWSLRQPMLSARAAHAAAVVDNKLYVFGGKNPTGDLKSVEEYNPAANEWTAKADMPTTRSNVAAAAVDSKIYVMGGTGVNPLETANEMYDPSQNSWTPRAPMPIGLYAHSATAFGGKIYVTGGISETGNNNADIVLSAEMLVYDPDSDTWTFGPPLPTTRGFHAAAVLEGRLYAIGGGTADFETGVATSVSWTPGVYYPFVKD